MQGEKLFKCKLCEKAFADSSYLELHVKRHSVSKSLIDDDLTIITDILILVLQ